MTSRQSLKDRIEGQVALLQDGRPLEAFDVYFAASVRMYSNDEFFASSAEEGRRKQLPFFAAAVSIRGAIADLNIDQAQELCVFRNRSRFTTDDGAEHQIDGLIWQKWSGDFIIEERYYDGELMEKLISQGVLNNPRLLLTM